MPNCLNTVSEQSSRSNFSVAERFSYKFSGCRKGQVCQGVKCYVIWTSRKVLCDSLMTHVLVNSNRARFSVSSFAHILMRNLFGPK